MAKKTLSKSEIKELNTQLSVYSIELSKKDSVVVEDKKFIEINKELAFFYDDISIVPTLKYILKNKILKTVTVDMGAIKFVIKGADIMRPGITKWDETIQKDEYVTIIDETHSKPLAIGKMLVSAEELATTESGKVIKNIHYVSDEIWNK